MSSSSISSERRQKFCLQISKGKCRTCQEGWIFFGSPHVFFMETAMIGLVVKITLIVEANSIPSQWLVGIEEFKMLAYPREDILHSVSKTRIVTLSNSRPHDVFHFSSLSSGTGFPLRIHFVPD
jgi:hypothetical protein